MNYRDIYNRGLEIRESKGTRKGRPIDLLSKEVGIGVKNLSKLNKVMNSGDKRVTELLEGNEITISEAYRRVTGNKGNEGNKGNKGNKGNETKPKTLIEDSIGYRLTYARGQQSALRELNNILVAGSSKVIPDALERVKNLWRLNMKELKELTIENDE